MDWQRRKMTSTIFVYDGNTGEEITREMTEDELDDYNFQQSNLAAEAAKKVQAEAQAAAKRTAAIAKLEALGLDEDDLKALGL